MFLSRTVLGALVLALPVTVEVPVAPDSSVRSEGGTSISVVGGVGRYAIIDRGCGIYVHPVRYRETATEIEHRFSNGAALGVRGGVLREEVETKYHLLDFSVSPYRDSLVVERDASHNVYVNPHIGLEGTEAGIGIGWIWARNPFRTGHDLNRINPSVHLRVGSEDRVYFKVAVMENVPLIAGGGYGDIGFGVHPHRLWDLYAGASVSPFDGVGVSLKADCRVLPRWVIAGRARLGESEGESENGLALGLTYTTRPAVPPRPASPAPPTSTTRRWTLGPLWPLPEKAPTHKRAPGRENASDEMPAQEVAPGATSAGEVPVLGSAPGETPAVLRPLEDAPQYGEYVDVDSLPAVLTSVAPVYPVAARAAGAEGRVTVAVLVGPDGRVHDTRVVMSIPLLDEAAVDCAKRWVFRPALKNGKPVACWTAVGLVFRIVG